MLRTVTVIVFGSILSAPALADDKPKRLSIDFTGGIRPDMAGLGSTISKDGTLDTADSTVASTFYSTDKALMSDQSNGTLWGNSNDTESIFKVMGQAPEYGGSMLGIELGSRIRYELDDVVNFPLFIQSGIHFSQRISGGYQSRTLGDIAEADELSLLFAINQLDPADYSGGTMINQYDASWLEVPVTLGIKVPLKKPYTFAYGSFGASYFSGGFSVEMDVDEVYANVLATHIDLDADVPTMTSYSPGAVSDTISFNMSGIGLNYGLGVQAGIRKGVAFFAELNSSGAAKTVYGTEMKTETKQLLTALSSESLAQSDPEWFDTLAFPVLATGASFRTGIRVYFF
ncbi:MAG: hypothetical protein ACI8RZ_001425 [Myxococcota bacterium]|jgi:hypothetical protein